MPSTLTSYGGRELDATSDAIDEGQNFTFLVITGDDAE